MRARKSFFRCAILAAALGCAQTVQVSAPVTPVQSRLHDDLAYLASPALTGRLAGTPGADSAASFIAHRYYDLGLAGAYSGASCGMERCDSSYFQMFQLTPPIVFTLDVVVSDMTQNVGAIVRGTDPILKSEFVIVGAHYDHIGRSNIFALDRSRTYRPALHLGADDNASGTVAVLELARRFAEHPGRRSVLFANFGAEELGLIGSKAFVDNSPVPIAAMIAMINLDMVGRLRDDRLNLFDGEASERFHVIVDSVEHLPPALSFHFGWLPSWRGASDQISFSKVHVPVLALFTDYHPDYHRSTDIVDHINFPGLEKVVDFAERLVRAVADGTDRPSNVQSRSRRK